MYKMKLKKHLSDIPLNLLTPLDPIKQGRRAPRSRRNALEDAKALEAAIRTNKSRVNALRQKVKDASISGGRRKTAKKRSSRKTKGWWFW
jgi:hypothetical protein